MTTWHQQCQVSPQSRDVVPPQVEFIKAEAKVVEVSEDVHEVDVEGTGQEVPPLQTEHLQPPQKMKSLLA